MNEFDPIEEEDDDTSSSSSFEMNAILTLVSLGIACVYYYYSYMYHPRDDHKTKRRLRGRGEDVTPTTTTDAQESSSETNTASATTLPTSTIDAPATPSSEDDDVDSVAASKTSSTVSSHSSPTTTSKSRSTTPPPPLVLHLSLPFTTSTPPPLDDWLPLDTRRNERFPSRNLRRVFRLDTPFCPPPSSELRLRITTTQTQMCQITRFECINATLDDACVLCSGENPPSETASHALSATSNTKWLDPRMLRNHWISFRVVSLNDDDVIEYAITSGNDAPERDPFHWTLEYRPTPDVDAFERKRAASLLPTTRPIDSVDALLDFKTSTAAIATPLVPRIVRSARTASPLDRSKLLVCHDMRGGYLPSDRFLQRSLSLSSPHFSMREHWDLVDIFVYFSHHFVTIPPKGWIDSAHRSGVECYGTLITEWERGKTICARMLASDRTADMVVDSLLRVQRAHGFDGWLVNIENAVEPTRQLPRLRRFLRRLKERSKVIWYDSVVTPSGRVSYQNCLNGHNRAFFDDANGIFTNYRWTGADVPRLCALRAGHRRAADVFMGIDVFGRGTFGGGGFNTGPTCEIALRAGVSAAIFAPGWIAEKATSNADYDNRAERFWSGVREKWAVPSDRKVYVAGWPLRTTFSRGYGEDSPTICGVCTQEGASSSSWRDLSSESPKLSIESGTIGKVVPSSGKGLTVIRATIDPSAAFDGDAGLRFRGVMRARDVVRFNGLFSTHLNVVNALKRDGAVVCAMTFKRERETLDVSLEIEFGDDDRKTASVVLRPPSRESTKVEEDDDDDAVYASEVAAARDAKIFLLPARVVSHANQWTTRVYVLTLRNIKQALVKSRTIRRVNVILSASDVSKELQAFRACLGRVHIGPLVAPAAKNTSSVTATDVCWEPRARRVSFTLRWTHDVDDDGFTDVYALEETKTSDAVRWIGRARASFYRVHRLHIEKDDTRVVRMRLVTTKAHDALPRPFGGRVGSSFTRELDVVVFKDTPPSSSAS